MAQTHSGLLSVTYPTGSGRSPRLAATIHRITPERNQSRKRAVTHQWAYGLNCLDLALRVYPDAARKFLSSSISPPGDVGFSQ